MIWFFLFLGVFNIWPNSKMWALREKKLIKRSHNWTQTEVNCIPQHGVLTDTLCSLSSPLVARVAQMKFFLFCVPVSCTSSLHLIAKNRNLSFIPHSRQVTIPYGQFHLRILPPNNLHFLVLTATSLLWASIIHLLVHWSSLPSLLGFSPSPSNTFSR